jgi:acyl carrier protein
MNTVVETEALAWIIAWFEARGPVPGADAAAKAKVDYFEAGLLDSIGVVDLVSQLEEKFGVRFTDRHFQEPRFSIIGGLAGIVAELKG